jgi:hypothetical protein
MSHWLSEVFEAKVTDVTYQGLFRKLWVVSRLHKKGLLATVQSYYFAQGVPHHETERQR